MNLENMRTPKRPKLTLPFGKARTEHLETMPGLSGTDLRRIVAAMIG